MKVIVALDQSVYASQVIAAVIHRRWHKDTAIKLLTVVEPLPFEWEQVCSPNWKKIAQEIQAQRKKDAEGMLASARKELEANVPSCTVHMEIRHGRAREEIVDAAVEWLADKIVVGAHGQSPNRLFPGSVSRSVAQHATCSVELIRLVDVPVASPEKEVLQKAVISSPH